MRPLIIMHGENIDWCHTVIRMLMYLVGVAVLALGMSLQTASGLGVAALTCFATTLSMLTGKTLGFACCYPSFRLCEKADPGRQKRVIGGTAAKAEKPAPRSVV